MLVRDTPTHTIRHGSSLSDVASYVRSTPRIWRANASFSERAQDSWDLSAGYDGTITLMTKGWSQGVRQITERLGAIPPTPNRHASMKYDVAGHYPDVARYLSGVPDSMITKGQRMASSPVMHLVVNSSASAYISSSEMINYGAAMVALVDQLESLDHRVELDIVYATTGRNMRVITGWKVKQASEHLDLADVAFSMSHPGAFRRIGFALYERTVAIAESETYGVPVKITRPDLQLMEMEQGIIVQGIQTAKGMCSTLEKAVIFAKAQVAKAYEEYTGQSLFEEEN